jgi:hypothetical protein
VERHDVMVEGAATSADARNEAASLVNGETRHIEFIIRGN